VVANPATCNRVTDNYGTVGGGGYSRAGSNDGNPASDPFATVAGGYSNLASGGYATVGGGGENTASGENATVGGGGANTASGWYATVPGGCLSQAKGDYSFAAGRRAVADGQGSFVWGDSNNFDLHAWGANQFVVRATGGFWMISGIDASGLTTSGARLPAGSGSWGQLCDRNAKANCAPVHPRAVLEKVAALPISTWNYIAQDPSIRHVGPMAQDFYAAFGLGEDDKHIATVDADGVALAAIQGLHEILREKDAEIAEIKKQNAELQERLSALENLVQKVSKGR